MWPLVVAAKATGWACLACLMASAVRAGEALPRVYWTGEAFAVPVRVSEPGDGRAVRIALYARRQGEAAWTRQGESDGSEPIVFAPGGEGAWELMTRGFDGQGWIEKRDTPQLVIVFRSPVPDGSQHRQPPEPLSDTATSSPVERPVAIPRTVIEHNTLSAEEQANRRGLAARLHIEAITLEGQGHADLAGRCLARAVQLDPSNEDALLDYADLLTRHQRHGEAIRILATAATAEAASARLLLASGEAHRGAGHYEMAAPFYERAIQRAPASSPIAHSAAIRRIDVAIRQNQPAVALDWIDNHLRRSDVPPEHREELLRLKRWCAREVRNGPRF